MSAKRPLSPDGLENGSKRIRSNNGSPAAAHGESELERKKREAAERMAAVKARLAASKPGGAPSALSSTPAVATTPSAGPGSDVDAKRAEAQRKIDAVKARLAAARSGPSPAPAPTSPSPVNGSTAAPPPTAVPLSEKDARIAEARARAAELSKRKNLQPTSAAAPPPRQDGRSARGGLGIGLHPSLMADTGAAAGRSRADQGPKFSTTRGNQKPEAPKVNPYLPTEEQPGAGTAEDQEQGQDATYDPTLGVRKGGERKRKELVFNEKGKYMQQANALRKQARLEEMKKRIAEENRKVEIEEASDKSFLVPAPPKIEWWDEGLLPEGQESYEECLENGRNLIDAEDSIITALIQRPVLLQAPQDKLIPPPKPLMLTTKEQKKLRRQRRMADMKEEQAKIRLGLMEPPPPKVKKSNMMRVLGEQAVKDPTAVEARVNREIAQRAADHARANEDRMLTKEQRAEKLKTQQAGDEAKGVKIAVFKVADLSSGKHRYQVDVNAKQQSLTGIVVLHPQMNLVIVEGGAHSINKYKTLLLNRVKWAENTLPLSNAGNASTFTYSGRQDGQAKQEGERVNKAAAWCNPLTEDGELKDLSENSCVLVWEGDEQKRAFKRWGSKAVETDGEARDVLSRSKMENFWTLARGMS